MKVDIDNHLRYSDEEYKLHLMVRSISKVVGSPTQLTPYLTHLEPLVQSTPSEANLLHWELSIGSCLLGFSYFVCVVHRYPSRAFTHQAQLRLFSTHGITLNTDVKDATWTKLETDHLVQLSLKYDLRWPVIKDRYKCTPDRPVQELQKRFYDVANRLQVTPTNTLQHSIRRCKRVQWRALIEPRDCDN